MKRIAIIAIAFVISITTSIAQRKFENLGRGVVAVRVNSKNVFISWRLLALDPTGTGFNIYRSTAGAAAVKLNAAVLTEGTNYTDASADLTKDNSYFVKAVIQGEEKQASGAFTLTANHAYEPCVVVPIKAGSLIHFVWVGDLDGDGEYDYVVDRIDWTNGGTKIEAYKHDGTYLWTLDYGANSKNMDNISPGSSTIDVGMWDGVTTFDIDNDGKSEVITKIANGVKFGDGSTWTNSSDTKQWIAVLDGMTGARKAYCSIPTDYISTGPLACQLGIGYLDGINPSIIARFKNRNADKSFNAMICAFKMSGGNLTMQWKWLRGNQACPDFHQLRIVDVDQDGKDDICDGGYVLKHDGTLRYSLDPAGIVHGDRFHIGKLDPNRAGLQGYGIQQENPNGLHDYYYDAGTGEMIWQHTGAVSDLARGVAADVDPTKDGYEVWTFDGLYNAPSNTLQNTAYPYPSLRFWWDGDDLAESYNDGKIEEWNYAAGTVGRIVTTWNFNSATGSDRGAPMFYGDIMGDWREEAILTSSDFSKLIIFTTNQPTTRRLYTLAHNPEYRNCMTVKGYVQSNMLDYYLGNGMATPPVPNITYPNQTPTLSITAPATNSTVLSSQNVSVTADAYDNDGYIAKVQFYAGTTLIGTATAKPFSIAWSKPAVGTYSITAKATDNRGAIVTSTPITLNVVAVAIVTQTISLAKGWNLISINVHPTDSTVATLFKDLDLLEIKDMNSYWRKDQPSFLNCLQTITSGNGYLVNMNTEGTLSITGTPVETQNFASLPAGWNLIGCPYQTATPIAGLLGSNFLEVKDFEGFMLPNGTTNSIENIEPGKGYFIKK